MAQPKSRSVRRWFTSATTLGAVAGALICASYSERTAVREHATHSERYAAVTHWVETAVAFRWNESNGNNARAQARRLKRDLATRNELRDSSALDEANNALRQHLAYVEAQTGDDSQHTPISTADAKALRNALRHIERAAHRLYKLQGSENATIWQARARDAAAGAVIGAISAAFALTLGIALALTGTIARDALRHRRTTA